jgi:hypothetical protein
MMEKIRKERMHGKFPHIFDKNLVDKEQPY